jgi:hypothetical protein
MLSAPALFVCPHVQRVSEKASPLGSLRIAPAFLLSLFTEVSGR